jgi:hypothetical protein
MIKKLIVLATILALLLAPASPVGAATGVSITSSTAITHFPDALTFRVAATSAVNVSEIRLHYIIERNGFAGITSEVALAFTPGKQVDTSWTLEMLKIGGLPPGAVFNYWWTVTDISGGRVDSSKAKVFFEDQRYTWKSLSDGILTLNWYEGNDAFAGSLITAAKDALKRLVEQTGAAPEKPVRLYIYAGATDLRGAMINPQGWTGGVNYARYSIIVIGIAPGDLDWGVSAIAHELTHQIIDQVTSNPYGGLPTWLDEGLAVHNEDPPAQDYPGMVARAAAARGLITVRSLASPFSAYGDAAYLSYAESYSIIDYLINHYGEPKMLELLRRFRAGETYDRAIEKVYGLDTDGLNSAWQASLTGGVKSGVGKGNAGLALPVWLCRDGASAIPAFYSPS